MTRSAEGWREITFDREDFSRWLDEHDLCWPTTEESIRSLVSWYVVERAETSPERTAT